MRQLRDVLGVLFLLALPTAVGCFVGWKLWEDSQRKGPTLGEVLGAAAGDALGRYVVKHQVELRPVNGPTSQP